MSILVKSRIPEVLFQVLDTNGNFIDRNYVPKLSVNKVKEAYYWMNLSRERDKKMLMWQRTGKMLTFAPCMGEEALQLGTSLAMQQGDWLLPAFRSDCMIAHRQVPLHKIFLYWLGSEKGSTYDKNLNVLPVNITIGAQISQAAGVGYALKLKGLKNAAVTFIGDGGTAEGEFYEAINMAAIHKWNTLFCINNNQYAISTRTDKESAIKDLSLKAVAFDIPRIRVDGNDLFASYDAALDALTYVRNGFGPVLIEFVTYRQGPHTTSDDPTIYRTQQEVDEALVKDPIERLRKWLMNNGYWSINDENEMKQRIENLIASEYAIAQQQMITTVDEIFDNQYAEMDDDLIQQKAIAKHYFENR
ncbi:pyruvate dehydrogenase (acetyl-transferring) E1 component subunit alpha [Mycoplasmoides pirum]|uniref:pyruvate dehydrogenase (acetyl-transferring) E1 component subunit alpha n=1 Tax=Mycoplasmoides pirum TaxID=2122 RepID=UPI0004817E00|nr:pyruvate dehydrogenase (acetyl-transferring) E1 component subunit alpha [Mycoplasmoides pirum]